MPTTPEELMRYLARLDIAVKTFQHPPLFTVEESRRLRGDIPGAHTKNLFLKDKKNRYFLVTVEEEARVDLKSLHSTIGASGRLSFGKAEELMDCLGVPPGAATVFGVLNDRDGKVTVVLDAFLVSQEVVNAHPLHNEATTSIRSADLLRFLASTGHDPLVLKVAQ